MITDYDAFSHPAYNDAVKQAAQRALASPPEAFAIYYDGMAIYVRASTEPKPLNSKLICFAQKWNDKTVQLRFDGAKSEWIPGP